MNRSRERRADPYHTERKGHTMGKNTYEVTAIGQRPFFSNLQVWEIVADSEAEARKIGHEYAKMDELDYSKIEVAEI